MFKASTWIALFLLSWIFPSIASANQVVITGESSIAPSLELQSQTANESSTGDTSAPATGAEILLLNQHSRVESSGLGETVIYVSILIKDEQAVRDYSRFEIGFDSFYTDLELDFANTLSTDGVVYPLAQEALQLRTLGGGQDFYSDESQLVFSLPKVAPGSLIELQYRYIAKEVAVPGLISRQVAPIWFQRRASGQGYRADPVRAFELIQKVPGAMVFQNRTSLPMPEPETSLQGDYRITHWRWNNIVAPELVGGLPEIYTLVPYIYSANQTDWTAFLEWANSLYLPDERMFEQVRPVLQELKLPETATEQDKIKAVYAWVEKNIRYVYAHLGRGGYQPHEPRETLLAGYGDCKDQALLVNTLMGALGIEARPVLVRTGNMPDAKYDLPRNIFDHIFTYLPPTPEREGIWFDTTGEIQMFPGASASLAGRPGLVLGQGQPAVVQALDISAVNRADLDMSFALNKDNKLELQVRTQYEGMPEQRLRSWYMYSNERDKGIREYLGAIYNDQGQYELTYQVHNAESLFEPFYITATFTFYNAFKAGEPVNISGNARQLLQIFGIYSDLPEVEGRKEAFRSNVDINVSQRVQVQVPEGYRGLLVDEMESVESRYFRLDSSVNKEEMELELAGHFPEIRIASEDFGYFSQQIADIYNHNNWTVSLLPDVRQQALDQLEQNSSESELLQQLEKARVYLDQGEFQQAVDSAQAAVHQDETNGEAWYLLGTAQGMTGNFEASDAAYAKAEALGYRY